MGLGQVIWFPLSFPTTWGLLATLKHAWLCLAIDWCPHQGVFLTPGVPGIATVTLTRIVVAGLMVLNYHLTNIVTPRETYITAISSVSLNHNRETFLLIVNSIGRTYRERSKKSERSLVDSWTSSELETERIISLNALIHLGWWIHYSAALFKELTCVRIPCPFVCITVQQLSC